MHKPNLVLKASLQLASVLFLIYSLGVMSVINCSLPGFIKISLIIVLVIFLGCDLYRYAFRRFSHEIVKLWQVTEAEWCIQQRNGRVLTAQLSKHLLLTNWLVILRLELENRKHRALVLMPDMLKTGQLRQLKLYISTT